MGELQYMGKGPVLRNLRNQNEKNIGDINIINMHIIREKQANSNSMSHCSSVYVHTLFELELFSYKMRIY